MVYETKYTKINILLKCYQEGSGKNNCGIDKIFPRQPIKDLFKYLLIIKDKQLKNEIDESGQCSVL